VSVLSGVQDAAVANTDATARRGERVAMLVIYLHGFASSSQSSKATYFARRLREHGITLLTPDLNEPEFSTLTITRMLDQVGALIETRPRDPVALIGSSLGGFVAVQTAVRYPERIVRLILLAPALDLAAAPPGDCTLAEWKRTNRMNVFHYAYGRHMPLEYGLYADAQRYDSMNASLEMPIQIFQGSRDTAVDASTVQRWADARPHVEFHLLHDDHQLGSSLDYIWTHVEQGLITSKSPSTEPESRQA
jgi:pimeloyl-ACP methyl ester carboxylesterase